MKSWKRIKISPGRGLSENEQVFWCQVSCPLIEYAIVVMNSPPRPSSLQYYVGYFEVTWGQFTCLAKISGSFVSSAMSHSIWSTTEIFPMCTFSLSITLASDALNKNIANQYLFFFSITLWEHLQMADIDHIERVLIPRWRAQTVLVVNSYRRT